MRFVRIACALMTGSVLAAGLLHAEEAALAEEAVVVWIDSSPSKGHDAFVRDHAPKIEAFARDLGVAYRLVDVADGAPSDITTTPLISFVNSFGHSIYQGRYTTLDRARTFIRTMRFVPQGDAPLVLDDVPSLEYGRATIAVPLKITALEGDRPPDHDDAAFVRDVRAGLGRGFRRLSFTPRVELGRADRVFYLDVHPWLSPEGELFVSAAVFSHFHCKEPAFTTFDDPASAPWDERDRLLAEVGSWIEHQLERYFDDIESGDAFRPVSNGTPVRTWDDMAFVGAVDETDERAMAPPLSIQLEKVVNWTLVASPDGFPPAVQFRFPAPLDNWVGDAGGVSGHVTLPSDGVLTGTTGRLDVDARTVTMGEPDLDHALQGDVYLDTARHPIARFDLLEVSSNAGPLAIGRPALVEATGTFTLKGVAVPLSVPLTVEPFAVEQEGTVRAAPRLHATGRFTIQLEDPFNIARAEGPAPANNTLIIDLSLVFAPATAVSTHD